MDQMNHEFWAALDELIRNSEIVVDRPKGTYILNIQILYTE